MGPMESHLTKRCPHELFLGNFDNAWNNQIHNQPHFGLVGIEHHAALIYS